MTIQRLIALFAVLSVPAVASAQSATMIDRPDEGWLYLAGQVNVIAQRHGDFVSPYAGDNSFRPDPEHAVSSLLTFYTGARLGAGWEAVLHLESAGGRGLGDALGLAGFTNLDVVRDPRLGAKPYLARLIVRKIIALSAERVEAEPSPVALSRTLPARRLELRAGKFGIADFFDVNLVGSDSHLQFTNWTVDNNGAYDYAADTRGYTYAVIVEYDTPRWSVRGAEALMPHVANGPDLDWNLARARGENLEVELRPGARVTVRMLGYANHANMGSYGDAVRAFQAGSTPRPDIEASRAQGRVKYGAGANVEATAAAGLRLFARAGWNEGRNESFAYTEVNDTAAAGLDLAGGRWRRAADRAGVALVSNGLSADHREYLRLGGSGFLLGDGTLRYGREQIVEGYYRAHLWRGLSASAGFQYLRNPGYNQDRGPVLVESARLHVEF